MPSLPWQAVGYDPVLGQVLSVQKPRTCLFYLTSALSIFLSLRLQQGGSHLPVPFKLVILTLEEMVPRPPSTGAPRELVVILKSTVASFWQAQDRGSSSPSQSHCLLMALGVTSTFVSQSSPAGCVTLGERFVPETYFLS